MNYDEYARLFDKVFPLSPVTLRFLTEEFGERRNILDLGCGRGLYSAALSPRYTVTGSDISHGMIEEARKAYGGVTFREEDVRSFTGTYDGIFIIGNTLVHLDNRDEIEKECAYIFDHLETNGKLVIQIINYDRIYKYGITSLPEIARDGIRFIRNYTLLEEKTVFTSKLIHGGEEMTQSVPLFPLRSHELYQALGRSGFRNIMLYGSFSHAPFSPDESMALIATADKP